MHHEVLLIIIVQNPVLLPDIYMIMIIYDTTGRKPMYIGINYFFTTAPFFFFIIKYTLSGT